MAKFRSSCSFWEFERHVRTDRRYIRATEHEEFLRAVAETCRSRKRTLKKGDVLWRAQLGHAWTQEARTLQDGDVAIIRSRCAYPPERMKPLSDRASEGRANPKGIPYLYLANCPMTAALEVRPWIGTYITFGRFRLLRDVEVVDCSINYGEPPAFFKDTPDSMMITRSIPLAVENGQWINSPQTPETDSEKEHAVWCNIDRAFSTPMTRSDDSVDYATTQIIAEVFKSEGFGGVSYRSSFGNDGRNFVLFDTNAAEILWRDLYNVDGISLKISEHNEDS